MENGKRRIIAIGDIHGCASELESLIERLAPTRNDLLVFLGDYIDRGPNSARVIDLILELKSRCEVVALMGNHERMFLDFLEHPESAGAGLFILNGGSSTLANYAGPEGSFEIPEAHIRFFHSLKYFHEVEDYFFVHAGVPDVPLKSVTPDKYASDLLWMRQPFLSSSYDWSKVIVHGHTPVSAPEIKANRIAIDTGCVYDGALTAFEIPSRAFIQVEKGVKGESPVLAHSANEGSSRIAMRFNGRLPVLAGRPGERPRDFETLNYNQFGLLLRELEGAEAPPIEEGEKIAGTIAPATKSKIEFIGHVVRTETRATGLSSGILYGVRIDRVTAGAEGRYWIDRP